MDMVNQNFLSFKYHINTKRYLHAVENIGQKILFQVLITLVTGDIGKIKQITKDSLEINTPLKKFFTNAEILLLEEGKPSSWEILTLYKVVLKVCGLAPVNSGKWTKKEDGEETLESLLYEIKELRNQVCRNSHLQLLSRTQLETSLAALKALSIKIFNALIQTAAEQRKVTDTDRVEDAKKYVEYVIADVTKQLVET